MLGFHRGHQMEEVRRTLGHQRLDCLRNQRMGALVEDQRGSQGLLRVVLATQSVESLVILVSLAVPIQDIQAPVTQVVEVGGKVAAPILVNLAPVVQAVQDNLVVEAQGTQAPAAEAQVVVVLDNQVVLFQGRLAGSAQVELVLGRKIQDSPQEY